MLDIQFIKNQKAAVSTLVSFHKNITQKNFRSAYNCLSYKFQNAMDYYAWVDRFATTLSSSVDNIGGRQQTAKFNGTVTVIKENDTWKMDYIKNKPI